MASLVLVSVRLVSLLQEPSISYKRGQLQRPTWPSSDTPRCPFPQSRSAFLVLSSPAARSLELIATMAAVAGGFGSSMPSGWASTPKAA